MALTQSLVKEFLSYDPFTGQLFWNFRSPEHFETKRGFAVWNGKYADKPAFCTLRPDGYLSGGINNISYLTHRVIWYHVYGYWPDEIDHINHDKQCNILDNLRDVSHDDNMKNRSLPVNNQTGVMGVFYVERANKWTAQIRIKGVTKHLGYFPTKLEAVKARLEAEIDNNFHTNHGKEQCHAQ